MSTCLANKADLSAERLREALDYDPASGEFRYRQSRYKSLLGEVAGVVRKRGYRFITIFGFQYLAHRLAWLYMTGEWPADDIDHINGVRDDNRWHNLRQATAGENRQNQRRAHARNASGVLGVSWCADRLLWRAMIMVEGKSHFLGRHKTKEAAQKAYLKAKADLHPFQTIVPVAEAA